MSRWPLLLVLTLLWGAAGPLLAQRGGEGAESLDGFVQQVATLWSTEDVSGLMELLPGEGRLLLDTGSGTELVQSRHAAAALRALFAERETAGVRPVRVTVAGGSPARGFGELSWSFRSRGAPGTQTLSLYVGAIREGDGWRIRELRVMP